MAPLPFFYSREREDNVVTMPASRSPLSHHLQQRNHRKLSQPSEHQKKPWRKPWHCKTSLCLKVRPPNSLQLEVVEIEELLIESAVPARRIPEATRDVINITCCIWNPSCWTRCWSSTTSLEGGSCQKRDGNEISRNSDPAIYICSPAIRPKPSKIAALPAPPKIPFWKRHCVPNQEDAIGTACSITRSLPPALLLGQYSSCPTGWRRRNNPLAKTVHRRMSISGTGSHGAFFDGFWRKVNTLHDMSDVSNHREAV